MIEQPNYPPAAAKEKFTLTADTTGRLCVTVEWEDKDDTKALCAMRHAESIPVADIHPSRLCYIGLIEALICRKDGATWAERMKTPLKLVKGQVV